MPQPNAGHPGAQPTVTGKDADVLRRVADALEAAPPASPAEFVHALAQAVAAVVSNPRLMLGRSDQLGGDITITELQPGQLANGSRFTISVDSPGVAFSRPPWATVNRSDLKLRAGPASATSVAAQLADDRQLAEWTVVSPSTTLGVVTISALFFDVAPDAPAGPLRLTVRFADSERSLVVGEITAAE
jgi:hypothetical protein